MTTYLENVLETPILSRIRRNHGLEHASIHVLSKSHPDVSLVGHSDPGGFWLVGNLTTEQVRDGVRTALARLRNGEHKLAVHPNCGTNFVTSGAFAGLAAAAVFIGAHKVTDRFARIPMAIAVATLALIASQPFGFVLQERVTTSGDPRDMEIVEIYPSRRGGFNAHRVVTRG
ncbi:MAG TPA: DUF6391 domain-containing protein [Anaerolineales bacterium]|nr:DUF6391 domain-containing protein [Anaerolineales bacterium]